MATALLQKRILFGFILDLFILGSTVMTSNVQAATKYYFFVGNTSDITINDTHISEPFNMVAIDGTGTKVGSVQLLGNGLWGLSVPADSGPVRFQLLSPVLSNPSEEFAVNPSGGKTVNFVLAFTLASGNGAIPAVPHVFYGKVSGVMVNGVQWDKSTPLQIIDVNRNFIANTELTQTFIKYWKTQVPSDLPAGLVRFAVGNAVSGAFKLQQGQVTEIPSLILASGWDANLYKGWNLIMYSGSTATVQEALLALSGTFEAVYRWDASNQNFRGYFVGRPAFLNTLSYLNRGDAVWVKMNTRTVFVQTFAGGTRSITLTSGFNLVSWTGSGNTSVQNAFQSFGNVSFTVWRWNSERQKFLSYSPGRPSFLNDLTTLNHGDGLWVKVDTTIAWNQPARS